MEKFKPMTVIAVLLFTILTSQSQCFELDGPALPNRPWISVWNGPTHHCQRFGIPINLTHFDIVQNPFDTFVGEFMTILYHPGFFPRIAKDGKTIINGGIPQLGNMSIHIQQLKLDIEKNIPDRDFKGLGVIDFESYKPLWDEDWDQLKVYRDMSRDLVRKRHPDWSKDKIEEKAKYDFEYAAREFMLQSLKMAVYLRPHGHWGYYHYPYCFDHSGSPSCRKKFKELNDKEAWLFDNSQALYPSIYLRAKHPESERPKEVHAILQESFRVANDKSRRLPVFVYTKFQYNEETPFWFYTDKDLKNTIKMAADFGSAGSVIWSPSDDFFTKEGCLALKDFMDNRLGPLVRKTTEFTVACSRENCSDNGRCVMSSYFPPDEYTRSMPDIVDFRNREAIQNSIYTFESGPYDEYACRCYKGWHGTRCEIPDIN